MSMNYLADQVTIPGKRIQDTQVAAGWQGAARRGCTRCRLISGSTLELQVLIDLIPDVSQRDDRDFFVLKKVLKVKIQVSG